MPCNRRSYTDTEKALALETLRARDGNVKAAAAELGIPRITLQRWKQGDAIDGETRSRLPAARGMLADLFENLAYTFVAAAPGKVPDATLAQVMTGAGIAVDKMRLLREQPTAISAQLTEDQRRERIAKLLEVEPEQLPDTVRELGPGYDAGDTDKSGD